MGTAYDRESGKLLYTEQHAFEYGPQGAPARDTVRYLRPDGSEIGRKVLDFRPSLYVPTFLTTLDNTGYQEGMRREDGRLAMLRRKDGDAQMESKSVDPEDCDAADAGFHPYVQANFDKVLADETVRFRFCAPGSLASVKFRAERIDDAVIDGFEVVRVRVEVDSFLSWFVDPLVLSYNPQNRDLVQYEGISNVRNDEGKAYDVRITYPIRKAQAEAEDAPADDRG